MKGKVFFTCLVMLALLGVLVLGLVACTQTLATPTRVTYSAGVLSWDVVEGASAYEVQLGDTVVARVTTNSYAIEVLDGATFRVRALSDAKRYAPSEYSDACVATGATSSKPALPTPTIVDVNGEGLLTWTSIVGATGYRIYRNNSLLAEVGVLTRYTLTFEGTGSFRYQVQAIGGGEWSDSARSGSYTVSVEDGKVIAPRLRTAEIAFDSLDASVTWRVITNAKYYVLYQNDAQHKVVPSDANTYTVAGVTYVRYQPVFTAAKTTIYVVAVGDPKLYRDSLASNSLAFPIDADAPPTNLHCEVQQDQVYLVWDALEHCLSYRIKLEQDGVLLSTYDTPYNRFNLQIADGEYQVSVCGMGNETMYHSTQYSEQYAITLLGGSLPPVELSAPGDLYLQDKTLYFAPVANASGYQVWVTAPYEEQEISQYFTVDEPAYELPPALYGSVVYLAVRALGQGRYATSPWAQSVCYLPVNEEGAIGAGQRMLAVPTLRLQDVTLLWSSVRGADGYQLCINDEVQTLSDYTFDLSGYTGTLVCKVRALSGDDNYVHSPYCADLIVNLPIALPTPHNVHIREDVLEWDNGSDAAFYRVDINGEYYDTNSSSLALRRVLTIDGNYVMRVKAIAQNGWQADSLYSQTVQFEVDYQEQGTEAKPYPIATAEDWATLQDYPEKVFAIQQDLDLGEVQPMFDNDAAFCGTLEGGGHTIRLRLAHAEGLFGALYGATIRNLNVVVEGTTVSQLHGVLAGYAQSTTWQNVSLHTVALASSTPFGSVGQSRECNYIQCSFYIDYISSSEVGGVARSASDDTCTDLVIEGTLSGKGNVGAVFARGSNLQLSGSIGSQQAVDLVSAQGNVGAVGEGSIGTADLVCNMHITVSDLAYAGAVGGTVSAQLVEGEYNVVLSGRAEVLFAGGLIGSGAASSTVASVHIEVEAQADRAYIGGFYGYANGRADCNGSVVSMLVNLDAPSGSVCGVAGVGNCVYDGLPQGDISVDEGVLVAIRFRDEQDPPQSVQWVVHTK